MLKVVDWIYERQWAITPGALETIMQIVENPLNASADEQILMKQGMQAVSARHENAMPDTLSADLRGRTAVIPIFGPIVPRAGFFTMMSGATSVDIIAKDFMTAMESPSVDNILLYIDSPGGEITGLSELSSMIREARETGKKRIVSYAMGSMASGAYWIGSAADEIVISETSLVGSIGVVALIKDTTKRDENKGVVTRTFVSSVSPLKHLGPDTEEGAKKIQSLVDVAASVFVKHVAQNRGVDEAKVLSDYGKGDVLTGAIAVSQGLADRLGSYEKVLTELNSISPHNNFQGGFFMSTKTGVGAEVGAEGAIVTMTVEALRESHPAVYEAVLNSGKELGAQSERERIQSVESLSSVPGSDTVVAENKYKPGMTKEAVSSLILESQERVRKDTLAAMEKDSTAQLGAMRGVGLSGGDETEQSADQKALDDAMVRGVNSRK
jgi:signal peptide peptidase SppA